MNPLVDPEKYLEVQITDIGLAVLLLMALVIILYRDKSKGKKR